jgi:hypothetical protein
LSRNLLLSALLGTVLAGLGACVSAEQIRAEDEATCAGYGFQRGTPEFANCLQQESLARRYSPALYGPPYLGPERTWWYAPPRR